MNGRLRIGRGGAAPADALVIISVLVLGFALVLPFFRNRAREQRMSAVTTAVETLRGAATSHLADRGAWPTPARPGVEPPELAGALPTEVLATEHFEVGWQRWEVIGRPERIVVEELPVLPEEDLATDSVAPPTPPPAVSTIGAVVVRSSDSTLLAGLLDRYGRTRSFVRDSVWTLVLPTRSAPIPLSGGSE